jgi:4-hydroxy-tetrahydrodipicolinate reductase
MLNGARGRMGAAIFRMASKDSRFVIAAQRDVGDAPTPATIPCDVVIDFSSDAGARDAATLALERGAALLVGSTGLSQLTLAALHEASRDIALLIAPNTSLGVAVLAHLTAAAARMLGPDFAIAISETHHTMKRDAPSGTALRLARALRERGGKAGAAFDDAAIHSIREGQVIGDHSVTFTGPGETITLSHSATSRDLFARGALNAAAFLAGKPAGRYSIEQALGVE